MSARQRLIWLATISFAAIPCPSADQLAAFALGRLIGEEQLRVAAHVRQCPVCAADVAAARPPESKPRPLVAQLLPIQPLLGRRSQGEQAGIRQYRAAHLSVELMIGPLVGEFRRLSGQVLRDGQGVSGAQISLRAKRRRRSRQTNEFGFFSFEGVKPGTHKMLVSDGQITLAINDLVVSEDEP